MVLQNYRLAIRMVDKQGWILRNQVIWHKPNCMPESVRDRFTVNFEPVFFFVKSKKYYFDQDAVSEPITDSSTIRLLQNVEQQKGSARANGGTKTNGNMKAVARKDFSPLMGGGGTSFKNHSGYRNDRGEYLLRPYRNKRAVWTIPIKPFSEAHFAVFPEGLVQTPILAGCPVNGLVLDPFMGAGTTALVAKKLQRRFVGIELNKEYIKIAYKRLAQGFIWDDILTP